ncbi:MAG: family 10 glycosylhydrolase [Clostridia bacterium]|nr:family 10 glycosylhydrolase [Clostridia bacterium]
MKKHQNVVVILTLILAVVSVIVSVNHNKNIKKTETVSSKASAISTEGEAEMRGMWVSYISLDMSNTDRSEEAFRQKFEAIADKAERVGCNALFVHVRAFCDAFYESEIFPSSHIIWGEQGKKESFDPLEIMCEICKRENLEIHAWINPYRVMTSSSNFSLAKNNPYLLDNSLGIEYDGGIYLNPASREARKLIVNGVKEIIENYKVDGIHFDDYFYPTSNEDFDKGDYNKYLKGFASQTDAMPLLEWRKSHVNLLISEVYREIKKYDNSILFGISPQGNIENDLSMGADVKSWCECVGYADYICPQLYYSLENPALSFKAGLESWLDFDLHNDLKLYAGLGVYKAGTDADSGTWKNSESILSKELEIIRNKKLDGFILYDYEAIISQNAKNEMDNFIKALD